MDGIHVSLPSVASVRAFLSTLIYVLWWPVSRTITALQVVLSPVWKVIYFVLLPVTSLLHAVFVVVSLPFRLDVLERVETVYIWLGVASLVGCLAGLSLFLIFRATTSALNIDAAAESRARARGRSLDEFRRARRRKQLAASHDARGLGAPPVEAPGARRRSHLPRSIIEEESE